MAIPSYIVFGIVTDSDSNAVDGGTVIATNKSEAGNPSTSDTTDSNGVYQIDLSNIATIDDGDIIEISCTYDGEYDSKSFTLTLSDPYPRRDLSLYSAYTRFSTATGTPLSWSWNSGQFTTHSGMRATSDNPTNWDWAPISSSSNYYYPSGSPTRWIWVSGSYQGGGV